MNVGVLTSTRADWGLLRPLVSALDADPFFETTILATGTHLSRRFGFTLDEIVSDESSGEGFRRIERIEILVDGDSRNATSKSAGLAMLSFPEVFDRIRPDMIVALGDRYEIFAACAAAYICRIPIAHLHGGETTAGAMDEAFRHSITKMAQLHFVANEEYRRRVIQLGEKPDTVHTVGGLGVDAIKKMKLMNKADLESSLGFSFGKRNLLITFHPETFSPVSAEDQITELLHALENIDAALIFTQANADPGNSGINTMIQEFVKRNPHRAIFTASLGIKRYLSCMQFVDGVVGNSSSGLLEAPSFKTGTVNIGKRQDGRLKATSVIDCEAQRNSIQTAISFLFSDAFRRKLSETDNPYGDGGAAERIVAVLKKVPPGPALPKIFHDIEKVV